MEAYAAKGQGILSTNAPFTKLVTRDIAGIKVFVIVTGKGMLMPEGEAGPGYLKILASEGVLLCAASETDPDNINGKNCQQVPQGDYISRVQGVLAKVESRVFDLQYPDLTGKGSAVVFVPLNSASLHVHPTNVLPPEPPPSENSNQDGNY